MKLKVIKGYLFLAIMFCFPFVGSGQSVDIQLSNTYFIENVNIIQSPGSMIEMGSIIIEDGIIKDVGKGLQAPANAIRIKADSMYMYPGFIDAYNNIGIKKQEEQAQQRGGRGQGNANRPANPGNPPNDKAGITPERSLADVFEKGEKSIKSAREAGFTASISAPKGGMLPGTASLIMHTDKAASEAIMKDNLAMVSTFRAANRMYPATIIGVMAKYRELYRQAKYAQKHEKAYSTNPVGMKRPSFDKSVRALYPIVSGDMPVIFEAEKVKDISKVMALQKDLGFKPILGNVKQGWHHMDEIKSMNIPVILSLDVPESAKKEDDKKKEDDEKEDEETKAMKERIAKAAMEYQSQAAMFAKNNIDFSFSALDAKTKDLKKNLKAIMEQGLTKDQILAALTVNPAKLFGVSDVLGTVEKGKLANVFISTKPYFDDDSNIKYVFVEGEKFEMEIKEKKKKEKSGEPSAEEAVDLSGVWSYEVQIPGDSRQGKMNVSKSSGEYKVALEMDGEEIEVDDVEIQGNKMEFNFDMEDGGFSMKIGFILEIDGDDLEGTVTAGDFGSFPVEGERISKPN